MATYDFGTKTYTDSFYGGNSYKLVEPVTIPAALRGVSYLSVKFLHAWNSFYMFADIYIAVPLYFVENRSV